MSTAEALNEMKNKYDIFFTPNGDYKNIFWEQEVRSQKWRSEKAVIEKLWNIYSFNADNDLWEKMREEVWLKPTIVNKTKRWYHMYFILKNPVLYKEKMKEWKAVEVKLQAILHADPTDISRILRVPWFKYRADNKWEVEITNEEYNPDEIHTFEEREKIITNIYDNTCYDEKDKGSLKKQFKWKRMCSIIDLTFNEIKVVQAIDVLEDLYPQFKLQANWEIYENGKWTKWYRMPKVWNRVNNFSQDTKEDRPEWWPWHIAMLHYKNVSDVLDYFEQKWKVNIKDLRHEIWSAQEITFQDIKAIPGELPENKPIRYWNNVEWILIYNKKKEILWYNADAEWIPFVKWLITPIGKTVVDNEEKYIIKIEKLSGDSYITLLPASGTVTEFRRFLQSYGLMVPDKSKFFIILYEYIFQERRQYGYTNKLWLQIINWKKMIISKTGTYVDQENQVYISIEDAWIDSIVIEDNGTTIKDYVWQLLWWYDGQIALPAFLTMVLWVNSFFFRNNNMQLPQWFLFWLSQSWKTTLLDLLFKSFWITKDISALSKAFVYEKYARHYVPTHFSEYRNSSQKQSDQIEWIMRNLFDWTPIEKWRSDQKTNKYESNWLYIIDWQTIFTDDGAQTRMIVLMGNKKYQGNLSNLERLPNIFKTISEIFKDEEDFRNFVSESRKILKTLNKRVTLVRFDTRTMTNYSYLYALLDRFEMNEYYKYLDLALTEQDWLTAQDDIHCIYQKVFNLQVISKYNVEIYKRGMIINVIEEWLRVNTNINDLKWFIKTVNANFLWANSLPNLATYVDFDYVYAHPWLYWSFFRMLNVSNIDTADSNEEEKKTVMGLYIFLKDKCPNHQMLQDISFEAYSPLKPNIERDEIFGSK